MRPILCFILLIALVLAVLAPAFALTSDDLRCDGGIVSVGDMASELVRKCGEPSYTSQREQRNVEEAYFLGDRVITTILIDDWTFNFGPSRFQYRVLLKNGRVWKIESLNYGY
jgi:hypothetical protein